MMYIVSVHIYGIVSTRGVTRVEEDISIKWYGDFDRRCV